MGPFIMGASCAHVGCDLTARVVVGDRSLIAPANQAADPLKPTVGAVVFTEAACGNTSFVLQLSVAPWPAGSEVYGPGILYAKLYNKKDVL